jgi:curved DNA-binding protein CbpA
MPDPDLYKVLQVDPEADPDVIQAAYRRLAQKFHPDLTSAPEAVARMVLINRAWETLRDPDARSAYDRLRAADLHARRPGGSGHIAPTAGPASPSAGPPPGDPSGSVVPFGRYEGWTIGEIGRADVDYLEWLDRMPIGRPYRNEIDPILRLAGRRGSAASDAQERRGLFRRR